MDGAFEGLVRSQIGIAKFQLVYIFKIFNCLMHLSTCERGLQKANDVCWYVFACIPLLRFLFLPKVQQSKLIKQATQLFALNLTYLIQLLQNQFFGSCN